MSSTKRQFSRLYKWGLMNRFRFFLELKGLDFSPDHYWCSPRDIGDIGEFREATYERTLCTSCDRTNVASSALMLNMAPGKSGSFRTVPVARTCVYTDWKRHRAQLRVHVD